MIKKFTLILACFFSIFFMDIVSAADTLTDITSPNFVIDLSNIDPVNQASSRIPGGTDAITMLLAKIANFLLFVMPLIAAVSLIFAGYFYILSSGDSEKASRAKTIIKWNAIAIIIALFSYTIIAVLATILDATSIG